MQRWQNKEQSRWLQRLGLTSGNWALPSSRVEFCFQKEMCLVRRLLMGKQDATASAFPS